MTTDEKVPNLRYGLHIWTYHGDTEPVYYCRGILGQYIISIPSENLVIVRLGSKRDRNYEIPSDKYNDKNYLEKHKEKMGHPVDLFENIKLGKLLAKEIEN